MEDRLYITTVYSDGVNEVLETRPVLTKEEEREQGRRRARVLRRLLVDKFRRNVQLDNAVRCR